MATLPRIDVPEYVYHAYNCANAGGTLFATQQDYGAFEHILHEALKKYPLRIFAYCIMPNHWHFVCSPTENGGMGAFFRWVTATHAKRWHAFRGTSGAGHLYQDRFKSNVCSEESGHFLNLARYVERNALRAHLVERAEKWRWGSAWCRLYGTPKEKSMLTQWPIDMPHNYLEILHEPQGPAELDPIRISLKHGSPFGPNAWCDMLVEKWGRSQERPLGF